MPFEQKGRKKIIFQRTKTEWEQWFSKIAHGCSDAQKTAPINIPSVLPTCALTQKACRFEDCPKRT